MTAVIARAATRDDSFFLSLSEDIRARIRAIPNNSALQKASPAALIDAVSPRAIAGGALGADVGAAEGAAMAGDMPLILPTAEITRRSLNLLGGRMRDPCH